MANHRYADLRMLELIDILKECGVIKYNTDYCRAAEIHKQTIARIKAGAASFQAEHIGKVCGYFNVNANWVLGLEKNVFRGEENTRELDRIIFKLRLKARKNATSDAT